MLALELRIFGEAHHVGEESICPRDPFRHLTVEGISVVNVNALAVFRIQ